MIKLTNGSVQDAGGVVQPNGYLVLQLNADATVIASPGTVVRSRQITFRFDANGNLSGSCQIYSNAELTPQTQYQVSFFDKNNSRLSDPQTWQFNQAAGSTVDIGTIVSTAQGISYPAPVLQNPAGQQTINGQTLNMEGASVGFSAAGSATADSFFSRLAAGFIAVGTAIGNALGTLVTAAIKQPPASANVAFLIQDANGVSHFFISNSAPYTNTFLSGNGSGSVFLGTAGKASASDTTGQLVTAGGVVVQTTSQTLGATIANDTAGGITFTTNAGKTVNIGNAGFLNVLTPGAQLTLAGATSGSIGIAPAAIAGSNTLTLPAATGTLALVPTLTLKKGSGAGLYSSASTSYVQVDGTNLTFTVTIPVGWKLLINAAYRAGTNTAAVAHSVGLADGGTIIVETSATQANIGVANPGSLAWVITGDGASHTIDLRYKTSNGADSVIMGNQSATDLPTMTFLLTPSN